MSFAIGRLTAEAPQRDEERSDRFGANFRLERFERLAGARAAVGGRGEPGPWLIVEWGFVTPKGKLSDQEDQQIPRWGAIEYARSVADATSRRDPRTALAFTRLGHTATLLPDGRVLVASGGGFPAEALPLRAGGLKVPPGDIRTCEIYDPRTERWSDAGELEHPRSGASATVLKDGQALLTGGWTMGVGLGRCVAVCEIYGPATNGWRIGGRLNEPRAYHRSVLLEDGRVLALGGSYMPPPPKPGAWLREPGNVLSWPTLASVEVLDPDSECWSVNGCLLYRRSWCGELHGSGAVLLADGTVLVHSSYPSGRTPSEPVAPGVERYDPATGTAQLEQPHPPRRETWYMLTRADAPLELLRPWDALLHRSWMGLGQERTVLFLATTAGQREDGSWALKLDYDGIVPLAGTYDPADGRWELLPTAGERLPIRLEAFVQLHDGRVLVTCGNAFRPRDSRYVALSWVFERTTGRWSRTGDLATRGRTGYRATRLADGTVLITGGHVEGSPFHEAALVSELYDPSTGSWRLTGSGAAPIDR